MSNLARNSTLSADAAQIDRLKQAAAADGTDSATYRQQLDDWLEAIRAQLGAEGNNSASHSGDDGGPSGNGSPGTGGPKTRGDDRPANQSEPTPAPETGRHSGPAGTDAPIGGDVGDPTGQRGSGEDTPSGSSPARSDIPPPVAQSISQITATAGGDAANTIGQIAQNAGANVGGETGTAITAWLTGVGANAASASRSAGGSEAEAARSAELATQEAANTTVESARAGAQAASGVNVGEGEAETIASVVAKAEFELGPRIGMALSSVARLGINVVRNVADATEKANEIVKRSGGPHAGVGVMAAEATARAALSADAKAGGGEAGRVAATELSQKLVEDSIYGGEAVELIGQAGEIGGLAAADAMESATVMGVIAPASEVLAGIFAAGGTPEQVIRGIDLITNITTGTLPTGQRDAAAKAASSAINQVLAHKGTVEDALTIGDTILDFVKTGTTGAAQTGADLVTALANGGATPMEEQEAVRGAQQAMQIGGQAAGQVLQQAAQQRGFAGVSVVMNTIEAAAGHGLSSASIMTTSSNALDLANLGDGVSSAYIRALKTGGAGGANQVATAVEAAYKNGGNSSDILTAAEKTLADVQRLALEAGGAGTSGTTIPSSSANSPDPAPADLLREAGSQNEVPRNVVGIAFGPAAANQQILIKSYTKLVSDLQSGADKDTVQVDARQTAEAAFKTGNTGTADVAIFVGSSFKADGTYGFDLSSALTDLDKVDPRTDGGRSPYYTNLDPIIGNYLALASDVAGGADASTIKQASQTLWGTAVADGHPSLGNVAISIGRSLDDGSYSQDGSLTALMNASPFLSDPAANGFGGSAPADGPSSASPPPAQTDETQAYQKLNDDLAHGSDMPTIVADATALDSVANSRADWGLDEAALEIALNAKAGTLNPASERVALQMAAPGTDGAKVPVGLQWAPQNSSI